MLPASEIDSIEKTCARRGRLSTVKATINGVPKSAILWFDNNFVGTELDPHLSYAKVAEGFAAFKIRTSATRVSSNCSFFQHQFWLSKMQLAEPFTWLHVLSTSRACSPCYGCR